MNPDDPAAFDLPGKSDPNDRCIPIFEMRPKRDGAASAKEGRPIHKMVPYVRIMIPGSRDYRDTEVTDEHRKRWPEQWAKFERGHDSVRDGTALEECPAFDRATVQDLRYLNIYTVEELAAVDDAGLQNIGPAGRKMKARAQAWLDSALGQAELSEAQQKVENLEAQVQTMTEQIRALEGEINRIREEANSPKRRRKAA